MAGIPASLMYPRRSSCLVQGFSGPVFVHAGLEGSVIALTNPLGEVSEKYRYTAFGLLTVPDAGGNAKATPALSPWLYHGRLYEEPTGLYWMRMRHYSPQLGRFLHPDPAGVAGGLNLYAYVSNNPLKYFDPWGLFQIPVGSHILPVYSEPGFGIKGAHHLYVAINAIGEIWGRHGSLGYNTSRRGGPEHPGVGSTFVSPDGHSLVGYVVLPADVNLSDFYAWLVENGNRGVFWPGTNDCHSILEDAADEHGGDFLKNPEYEGRLSPELEDKVMDVLDSISRHPWTGVGYWPGMRP